jgi:hypothetical protein
MFSFVKRRPRLVLPNNFTSASASSRLAHGRIQSCTNSMAWCSMLLFVERSSMPILWGGTPNRRQISSALNRPLSSNCASSLGRSAAVNFMPPNTTTTRPAFLAPP